MVEKMEMMNLVGHTNDLDYLIREIVLLGSVHPVDAIKEINESNFTLSMLEENVDEIINMCEIKPYIPKMTYKDVNKKLTFLMEQLNMKLNVTETKSCVAYEFQDVMEKVNNIYNKFITLTKEKVLLDEELEKINKLGVFNLIRNMDVNFKELRDMKFFNFRIGVLKAEDRIRLTMNYENISAAVMHLGIFEGEEVYMVVSVKELELETQRILNSVHFKEIEILEDYFNYPNIALREMGKRLNTIKADIEEHQEEILYFGREFGQVIQESYNQFMMELAVESIKEKVAYSRSYFYFSGWVPKYLEKHVEEVFKTKFGSAIILEFKNIEEIDINLTPPTKLRNNWFLKPFEFLVNMYGTPSYNEVDPTLFIGITYVVLFGAMFGDVGQGLVLLIAGIILSKKSFNPLGSGILTRLGISSMTFGFFYDSLFGYEHLISGFVSGILGISFADNLFMRPIENINFVLITSISLGVFLLTISFIYSIFNKVKQGNIQEGIFGRNGVAGLLLYMMLIGYLLRTLIPTLIIPTLILKIGIGISVISILLREPLTNIIYKKRPLYHESLSEYYVESGFDVIEAFLSLLSNSISFIRVGAFALNHVGLFIAFHTMAEMIGGVTGDIAMFIVGNLIVILLEGLIVFIQGLRLVYYEMFSKYYTGDGVDFEAAKIG